VLGRGIGPRKRRGELENLGGVCEGGGVVGGQRTVRGQWGPIRLGRAAVLGRGGG